MMNRFQICYQFQLALDTPGLRPLAPAQGRCEYAPISLNSPFETLAYRSTRLPRSPRPLHPLSRSPNGSSFPARRERFVSQYKARRNRITTHVVSVEARLGPTGRGRGVVAGLVWGRMS